MFQGDPTGVFAPSLAEHDGASSIVSAAHLQAQSRKLLKMLVEAMKAPKVASSRALVIISSLANIAAKRQEHAPYVVDALVHAFFIFASLKFFSRTSSK